MCVLECHFPVYILKQVSLGRAPGGLVSFCLIHRPAIPYVGKSPDRTLRTVPTLGKPWLLFLLVLLQLSSIIIIEKFWTLEDLILVQAFYIHRAIFMKERHSFLL